MGDAFKTISGECEGMVREKASRFFAHAAPAANSAQADEFIGRIARKYHDCRHICYAWRLGVNGEPFRVNDAGEPSGTAGKPILGQLQSFGVTNIVLVVARYFGGTKLGTGGLIQAYKAAAKNCLENADFVESFVEEFISCSCTYEQLNALLRIASQKGIRIVHQQHQQECTLQLAIRKSLAAATIEQIHEKGIIIQLDQGT
jgi:uncharacterized YigZ family protein